MAQLIRASGSLSVKVDTGPQGRLPDKVGQPSAPHGRPPDTGALVMEVEADVLVLARDSKKQGVSLWQVEHVYVMI